MKIFKIRASAAGSIMGDLVKPTEKQLELLSELQAKKDAGKITAKQTTTLNQLIEKRDAPPELPKGAKTYCEQWLKEQPELYGRAKKFSNKYTEKGEQCEPEGIKMVAEKMGYPVTTAKNEQYFEDEYFTGTPDILPPPSVVDDVKCSWDQTTFPLFEKELPNSDYMYQGNVYAHMTKRDRFSVNYCLIDTPEEMIDKAAYYEAKSRGLDEVDFDLYQEVAASMTYGGVHPSLKIKRYEFERNDTLIEAMKQRVIMCRAYIEKLIAEKEFEFSEPVAPVPEGTIAAQSNTPHPAQFAR